MFLSKIVILTAENKNRYKNQWVEQISIYFIFLKSAEKMLQNDI